METKVCCKCNIEKELSNFRKRKDSKDGFRGECKECSYLFWKNYRDKNLEILKEKKKKQYIDTKEKTLLRVKKYRETNIDIIREKDRERSKEKRKKEPNKYKIYYEKNKEEILRYKKIWAKKNKEVIKIKKNNYNSLRLKNDLIFRLIHNMRSRLRSFLKTRNITKQNKTFDIVGCSPEFLKEHLETQFVDGMSWSNRNEWHIDHIIPLSSAKTEEDIYKLCHYTNLQPLWAEDNIKKSNKILY